MSKPTEATLKHKRYQNRKIYIGKAYDYWQEYKRINNLNTDIATAFRLLSICSEVLGLDAMTKKIAPLGCTTQQTPVSTSSRDASTQITQKPDDDNRLGNEDNPQSDDDNPQKDDDNPQSGDDNPQKDDDNPQSGDDKQQIGDDSPQPSDNHSQVDNDHFQTDLDPNQPNKKLRRDPAFEHHCSGLAACKLMLNSTSTATSGTSSPSHTLDCNPTLKLGRNENGSVSESSCLTMTIKREVDTDVNEDLYEVKDEFSSPTHNNRLDRNSELVEIPGKLDCNEATDKPLCMEKEIDVTSVKEEPTLGIHYDDESSSDIFDTDLESTEKQRNTCQHFSRSPTRQDQLTQHIRTHNAIHYDDESSSDIFDTELENTEKQRNTCQHFTRSPTRQDQLT